MATKKTPSRRAATRKPAARAKTTAAAKKTRARPTATTARKSAAKKPPAARRSAVGVVSRLPAHRAGAATPTRSPNLAIFIDVENTSSEDSLFEVLDSLNIDRAAQHTEVTAVGNWRAISQRLARRLAGIGAQLVHSAPATGVRDWSDLWIAVAAGCWLGGAQPGDVLEIVSNDRAFDAVGDAAAARGVIYHRLLHKRGAHVVTSAATEGSEPKRRRRSRGGRRRRGRSSGNGAAATPTTHAPATAARHSPVASHTAHPKPAQRAPSHPPLHDIEPHGASRDQILSVIARLSGSDPTRWINLDVLEKVLKAEGFARPPGSPRLVTRLRMLKDIEIDSHGRARLVAPATAPEPKPAEAEAAAPKKRRRRRKTSDGGDAGEAAGIEAAPFAAAAHFEPPAE